MKEYSNRKFENFWLRQYSGGINIECKILVRMVFIEAVSTVNEQSLVEMLLILLQGGKIIM